MNEKNNQLEKVIPQMTDSGYFECECTQRLYGRENYCPQCGKALEWRKVK